MLGARLGADEQWRFPISKEIPAKFAASIVEFEDKRFYNHIGIDPISFLRALYHNIKRKKIVSGGSTLSMQVIRLARKRKSRSFFEKIIIKRKSSFVHNLCFLFYAKIKKSPT